MKPFQYSLQAVRTLREQQEQAALHGYSQALRSAEKAAEKLAAVQHELEDAWAELKDWFARPGTAEELARLQAYSQTVEKRRAECERLLGMTRQKVRLEFLKLVAARQAASVLGKHFEKQKRHHHHHQRRHEQKVLDDLAGRQNLLCPSHPVTSGSLWQ